MLDFYRSICTNPGSIGISPTPACPRRENRLLARRSAGKITIFVSIEKLRGDRSQYGSIANYIREDGPRKRLKPRRRKQDPMSVKSEAGERKRREVTPKRSVPQKRGEGQGMKKERPSKDDETRG